jgi:thioester reductase-like protein
VSAATRDSADDGLLLTGATGFVGMEILARYLERTDRQVFTLVRAADEQEAAERLRSTVGSLLGSDEPCERVVAVPADIEREGLGLDPAARERLARRVTDVIHAAASVSFSLPLKESRRINVDGTRRMLELAELCSRRGGLRRFSYVSTAYVAGDHPGEFREDQLSVGQEFRNAYERSKFDAEKLVRSYARRPATR